MNQKNTVTVNIYGQEYTLSGDMPRDYVVKLAQKVDETMKMVGKDKAQSNTKTAVLAALLLADEFFTKEGEAKHLASSENEWKEQADEFETLLNETNDAFAEYKKEQEASINLLRGTLESQEERFKLIGDGSPELQHKVEELEKRCRDAESSLFDLQMENFRLKNELDNFKNNDF